MIFGNNMRGKSDFARRSAVAAAKSGLRVLLATQDGNIAFEPGTGNIQSVSLPHVGGWEPDWIETDSWVHDRFMKGPTE
jgi:hypothetical protein